MTIIMEARTFFKEFKERLKGEIEVLRRRGVNPGLAALLIGDDPISQTYVAIKHQDCGEVGIHSEVHKLTHFSPDMREEATLRLVKQLNEREDIHGILVQLPLPSFVDEAKVFNILSPLKDVDGLTPYRMGKLLLGEYTLEDDLLPCTSKGVMKLLDHYMVDVEGKDAAVIGRGKLVGMPLRKMLEDRDATAVCYHRKTRNLKDKLLQADIIVSAAGRPPELYTDNNFRLDGSMVKACAVVIGVGVRRDIAQSRFYFDVDFESVKDKASYITPNLGGVGLMTRAMLLKNTIIATRDLTRKR